ncbi:hypothetical protein [Alkalicoccobacillus gibsonii]|jgi:hypothetical protein|uniref:hypothetical protein n=1 Tax=Alkalicoccobacillus gibsonii TaxID=79881 RepID=UPI001931A893|nr:hypothetical protein [Alkalicoccobacillus gibsonii]MBM0067597.1 hypothetical protein [Alkalicoccobacillus gibsonii]
MKGIEVIRAIQTTLNLLAIFVLGYLLFSLDDPDRGGTGMWFLLVVICLSIYFLSQITKKAQKQGRRG